jgi:hypothetical protein
MQIYANKLSWCNVAILEFLKTFADGVSGAMAMEYLSLSGSHLQIPVS